MKNLITLTLVFFLGLGMTSCNQDKGDSAKADTKEPAKVEATTAANDKKPADAAVEPDLPKTSVKFSEETHDFGDINQGDKVTHIFKFTNTGNEPLIISSAKGSCGCTVPEWPKEPIAPGSTGEMKVEFNSKGKKGKQTKTVTVQANTDPNPTRLTIKANILEVEGAEEAKK